MRTGSTPWGTSRASSLRRCAHPESLVCGRPVFDEAMPKGRFYGRYLTHVFVWLNTLSFDIPDSMCGFRVYPLAPVLKLLDSTSASAPAWIST